MIPDTGDLISGQGACYGQRYTYRWKGQRLRCRFLAPERRRRLSAGSFAFRTPLWRWGGRVFEFVSVPSRYWTFFGLNFRDSCCPTDPDENEKNMISSGGLGFCCVFEEFRCDLGDIYYLKMLDYRPTVFLGCHHDTYVLCIYIYIVHCNIQSCFCFERHLISESSRFSSTMCTETYDGDMALETTSNSSLNVSKCHLYPTFPQVFFCDL